MTSFSTFKVSKSFAKLQKYMQADHPKHEPKSKCFLFIKSDAEPVKRTINAYTIVLKSPTRNIKFSGVKLLMS